MAEKFWNDQPDEVARFPPTCRFWCGEAEMIIEIRAGLTRNDPSYFTAGNIFGSQTIRTQTLPTAVRLIDEAIQANKEHRDAQIPPGAVLLNNPVAT